MKEWGKEPAGRKGSYFFSSSKKELGIKVLHQTHLKFIFILISHLPQGKPGYTRYDNRRVHDVETSSSSIQALHHG
jgi:hypothetical protein